MIATSKALTSNVKSIFSKLVFNGFSHSKNGPLNNLGVSNAILTQDDFKTSMNHITKTVSFGITHAKHVSEINHEHELNTQLKKIEKTATTVHCFNPKTYHEEDVPIRILRTHYTVTFMPSVQFM